MLAVCPAPYFMIGPRRCLLEPCSRHKVSVVRFLRHHGNIAGWTGIKIPSRCTAFRVSTL